MSNNDQTHKKTLLEIQAEQQEQRERERHGGGNHQHHRGSGGGHGGRSGGGNRGGGGGNRGHGGGNRGHGGGGHRGGGGGGGHGARGGGGRRQHLHVDRSRLPLEHGAICTLKESFGFIRSAERPEEVFFHFSELQGCHSGDLHIDDEVEFRLGDSHHEGGGGSNKHAAFHVKRLPPGSVEWEHEEEPGKRYHGLVERPIRDRGGGGGFGSPSGSGGGGLGHNPALEGTIRLLVETQQQEVHEGTDGHATEVVGHLTGTANGPLARFRSADYDPRLQPPPEVGGEAPESSSTNTPNRRGGGGAPGRLSRGDFVEFNLFVEKRSRTKYARSITLLMTERERARQEEEKRMLAEASLEHGVVTALKGEYGFLRSNKRREEVYFHYSSVELEGGDGDGQGEEEGGLDNKDVVLKEGQEMQFLVVKEGKHESYTSSRPARISARRVKIQPRGSVKFHDVLAEGMTGTVSICPQPIDAGHSLEQSGKIQLAKPLTVVEVHQDDDQHEQVEKVITEVVLLSRDAPGGTYCFRGGTSVGLWIQPGDTLLFDVVKDLADGICRASCTRHLVPNPEHLPERMAMTAAAAAAAQPQAGKDDDSKKGKKEDEEEDGDDNYIPRRVRIIGLSLASRAEGVVNAVKDSYGFLHFAERPVDVHFRLYQIIPDEIQEDIRRNMGLANTDEYGEPLTLQVGSEVQFDLSVHGTIHAAPSSGGGPSSASKKGGRGGTGTGGGSVVERENLKAQRVLLLPHNTVVTKTVLASDMHGVVAKEDPKQPYAGVIELDTPIRSHSLEDRHPLVAKMIDDYLANTDIKTPIVFPDIQSKKEDEVVIELIELKAKGKLAWTYLPQPGESNYAGRLCIRKIEPECDANGDNSNAAGEAGQPTAEGADAAAMTTPAGEASSNNHATTESPTEDEQQQQQPAAPTPKSKKKKQQKAKNSKLLRFDKSSLIPELKEEAPPACGDEVRFDVVQARRTGHVAIEKMTIIKRSNAAPAQQPAPAPAAEDQEVPSALLPAPATAGVGVVKEIVSGRNYGFIAVMDETASARETLFFSLNSVVSSAQSSSDNNNTNNNNNKKTQTIRKGDEVKFDLATEKNGKRVALNVTVMPKGTTVPAKADKNACLGLVLLAPAHTTLKNDKGGGAPSLRHANSNPERAAAGQTPPRRWESGDEGGPAPGGGRKKGADKEETVTDLGCILLLEDPSNMFGSKAKGQPKPAAVAAEPPSSETPDQSMAAESSPTKAGNENYQQEQDTPIGSAHQGDPVEPEKSSVMCYLRYKTGALAIHGAGSSSDEATLPRRGDLVSFIKAKSGAGVRDVRLVKRGAAPLVRGHLQEIRRDGACSASAGSSCGEEAGTLGTGCAKFVAATKGQEVYDIDLAEVVSCDPAVLKNKENVEGILHEGCVHGVCRTVDLYLESKLGASHNHQRPKLNLTVKKDRGGTIMAQSMMAKGPDGTKGFASGWTTRRSRFAAPGTVPAQRSSLNDKAKPFIPKNLLINPDGAVAVAAEVQAQAQAQAQVQVQAQAEAWQPQMHSS